MINVLIRSKIKFNILVLKYDGSIWYYLIKSLNASELAN